MARAEGDSLVGKVVVLTGAASGIGRAAADAFSAAGAQLVLVDIDAERLYATRDEMTGVLPPLAVQADVSSNSELQSLVETVLERFGRIDVLINNAGLGLGGRFQDQDPVRLRKLVDVNLYGLMRLTQLVIPVMLSQGGGHILNVSSQAAHLPTPGYAGYAAAKAGVSALTEILRRELSGTGIHLTLFFPGTTRTAMTEPMIQSGKGTGRLPHHGPELPAAQMVDAVRHKRRQVIVSSTPIMQTIVGWVEKLFPRLMDPYWRSQVSDEYFEGASQSGRKSE